MGEIVELVGLDFLERDQFFLNPYSENNEKIPVFLFDGRKLRKLCRQQRVESQKIILE